MTVTKNLLHRLTSNVALAQKHNLFCKNALHMHLLCILCLLWISMQTSFIISYQPNFLLLPLAHWCFDTNMTKKRNTEGQLRTFEYIKMCFLWTISKLTQLKQPPFLQPFLSREEHFKAEIRSEKCSFNDLTSYLLMPALWISRAPSMEIQKDPAC